MDSVADDPRFSHIVTDPRFRSMHKTKRKVKIDKRFNALFSAKHFQTRTDIDKRGRPVHDVSKRNKHVMERFYELSSEDSDEDDSDSGHKSDADSVSDKEVSEDESAVKSRSKTLNSEKVVKKKESGASSGKILKPHAKKRKLSTPDPVPKESVGQKSKKIKLESESVDRSQSDDEDYKGKENAPSDDDDDDSIDESDSEANEEDESEEDEDSLPEYTAEFDLEETGIEHKWNELHADATEISESTRRLAVCNMDWDFVKAQDLYVLLKSFVPEGGRVKSVTIYPSEFGKKRMTEEALLGPKEMRDMVEADENGDDSANKDQQEKDSGKKRRRKKKNAVVDSIQEKRQNKDMFKNETEKLREYQMNRLQYYYAVVDCDSIASADAIYHECDGKEYQLSSVRLDLRYIPEDMTFHDDPKDSFSEEQSLVDYVPNRFNSTALSQAKVEVTWDETDFDRLSRRMGGLQRKELESIVEENQYADIIAPPESDSEGEDERPDWLKEALVEEEDDEDEDEDLTEEKKIKLYRKVLMDKLTEEKEAENDDVDKEIHWTPGLKSSAQEKLKKKKKAKEAKNDVVEGYLEKKKEKKRKKLDKKKEKMPVAEDDDALAFSDDDLPDIVDEDLQKMMDDEGVAVSKKAKSKKKKSKAKEEKIVDSEEEREKAELELLMMDDDGDKSVSKPKNVEEGKMSRRKKKKLAKLAKEKKEQEKQDFALDLNDDRFSALYTSSHFHIDPNAPQFKKTQNMVRLMNEQITRKKKPKAKHVMENADRNSIVQEVPDSKLVSKQLVESLQRKLKKK